MIFIPEDKVITFFYMGNTCLSVIQSGNGTVELLQLTEISNE